MTERLGQTPGLKHGFDRLFLFQICVSKNIAQAHMAEWANCFEVSIINIITIVYNIYMSSNIYIIVLHIKTFAQ